jgi:cellobiose-specific phosphotransferase system component IIC
MRTGILYGILFGAGVVVGSLMNHWAIGALAATLVSLMAVIMVLPAEVSRVKDREAAKRRLRYGNYQSTVHLGKNSPRKYDRYDIFSDTE